MGVMGSLSSAYILRPYEGPVPRGRGPGSSLGGGGLVEEGSRFWTPSSSLYGAYSWPTLVNHPLWREEAEAPEGAKTSPGSCGEQIGWAGSGGRKGLGCLQLSPLFPSRVFVQIPFCLGLGHGRLAWQGSWTSHLFEPRLSYLWK